MEEGEAELYPGLDGAGSVGRPVLGQTAEGQRERELAAMEEGEAVWQQPHPELGDVG